MKKEEYQKMFEVEDSHFWFLGKRVYIDAIIQPLEPRIKKILDIGCGTGGMTKFLTKYGQVIGVEKEPYALRLAKKRSLKVIAGDAQALPLPGSQFDLVTLFDVLYHRDVQDVRKALKETHRVLKPKGFLLLTDSALPFLKSRHDIAVYGKRRFFLSEIEILLRIEKFKILRASYLYFFLLPALIIKRLLLEKMQTKKKVSSDVQKIPDILNTLLLRIIELESAIFKVGVSWPIGSSVLVLAQKK